MLDMSFLHAKTIISLVMFSFVDSRRPSSVHVGGMFPQFLSSGTIDRDGSQNLAAFIFVINQINNKTDGWYDDILPNSNVLVEVRDSKRDFGVATIEAGKLHSKESHWRS